jgi:2-polyprenyl-3-methyl-5-hydroxy-6-metoxy-1,4-benzoquinol methylase
MSHPTPDLFFETAQAYQRTAALRSAIDLEIFTAISEGASTVPALAARCNAPERGVRILCDYLTIVGMLSKTGDTYQLTPETAVFLNKRSPAYLGGMMEFLGSPSIVRNFDNLTAIVRRGSVTEQESAVAEENPIWETFARAMVPMMMPLSQGIADVLDVPSTGQMRVLDIAAGHGVFGIALAQRNPQAEIVAVDWAGVLKVASENALKMGVGARHRIVPGDAFKVDWGTGYDVALVTNFLHHFDRETCTGLLRKIADSLKPGGRVAVLEFVPNDDRVSPPMAASFAMQMLAGTPAGDAYTFRELKAMLSAAGFSGMTRHPLQGPQILIVGRK